MNTSVFTKSTFLQAFKISAVSFLSLLLLDPFSHLSLIFIICSFFLFLPIICILLSALIFLTVLSQMPIFSLVKCFLNYGVEASEDPPILDHIWKDDDPMVVDRQMIGELEQSEVPSLELSEEEQEIIERRKENSCKALWNVHVLDHVRCGYDKKVGSLGTMTNTRKWVMKRIGRNLDL